MRFNKVKRIYHHFVNMVNNQNHCVILIYHRISNLDCDPQLLSVTPRKFNAHIRYLKKRFEIISLQELVHSLSRGSIPQNSVVITFDDGYADNLLNAKPILEKYGVPATVFVTAGMIDSDREYWWDELERIFLANKVYQPLELVLEGRSHSWNISCEEDALEVYRQMHPLLKRLKRLERDKVISQLVEWAGLPKAGRPTHRSLTSEELKELARGGLIEIGAHTMTHCVLAEESLESQEWEILESKKVLQNLLCQEIYSFSYPFGTSNDVTPETMLMVKKAGFNCGIANDQRNVIKTSDLFWVPRRLVRNWNLNEFQNNIDGFFADQEDLFDVVYNKCFKRMVAKRTYKKELASRVKHFACLPGSDKLTAILQVNTLDCHGGAAKVALRLNNRLISAGFRSRILAGSVISDDSNVEVLLRDNSRKQKLFYNAQQELGWLDFFHLASLRIKYLDIFQQSDLIHLHNLHGGYFSPFALPELTALKPTVWTLHDMQSITGHCAHSFDCDRWLAGCGNCPDLNISPAISKDTSAFLWETKKKIYAHSNLTVVCPSKWLKDKVDRSILGNKDVRLIYNGIDDSVFKAVDKQQARKELNLPRDKKIFLFTAHGGTDNYWKGGSFVNEAYLQLRDRRDVLFLNVGVKQLADEAQDENWINVPYISDENTLAKYYAAADLFIYPSLADNCPLVVLETMACGTPVVAFRTGGIPELVDHLKTGYLAAYKNTDDFIKGIQLFIDNFDLLSRAQHAAPVAIEQGFTLQRMTYNYIKLYEEIIRSRCYGQA